MKISIAWLKEFVDFKQTPEELAGLLRGLGFDVASITRHGGETSNVVTARVESVGKHPNADRLSLCKVFDGKTRWDVVCGAPNVAAGQTVPMARVGAKLPGGQTIEKATIRGQESSGMLCSARELALGQDHSGILVLSEDTPLGQDISETLELGDAILDVEVTPNRPDVLSHWGIARELSAALDKKLRLPETKTPKAKSVKNRVRIEDATLCTRYIGRVMLNVKIGPSPLRMKLRLERCGMRAINNVVDITNYVLLELGHPLHAFDLDRLAEGRVVVRMARSGESLECLDGVKRTLGESLVIADAEKPAAVAGIIGGSPSSVTESTKNILLESAHFQPAAVRRSRKILNVSTESSYRFERGTDPSLADLASRRAATLLLSITGAAFTEEQDAGKSSVPVTSVSVQPERINRLLGTSLEAAGMKRSLMRLGFQVKGSGVKWSVTAPVHRFDVKEEPDIAEEIARLTGYDRVPARLQGSGQMPEPASRERSIADATRLALESLGFFEARNYGLLSKQNLDRLSDTNAAPVELDNPLSTSGDVLSPSLLPALIQNLQTNLRYGRENVRLFEISHVFRLIDNHIAEATSLGWIASGQNRAGHWKHKPRQLEIWDAKSIAEALLERLGIGGEVGPAQSAAYMHPAQGLKVTSNGKSLGVIGKLHPRLCEEWELPAATFMGELDLSLAASIEPMPPHYRGLPKNPAVYRDFSLIFPDSAAWSTVIERLKTKFAHVEDVGLFDLFTDPSLPPDHKSLAFRVTFRHPEKTLTDAEVGEIQRDILSDLAKEFGAQLRSAPSQTNT